MNKKEEKLEEKKENEALLNQLKRLQADFDNYKKRVDKEKSDLIKNANAELVKELLPIIDSFNKALKLVNDEGLKLIYNNLFKTLEKQGLKEIESEGKKFDINLHEAVMQVTNGKTDNEIIEEVEKGYTFNGKVLRPSKVIVNKKV